MRLTVVEDPEALAADAASIVEDVVADRPDAVVLVATGDTPMGCYAELARRRAAGTFDASALRVAQLDEYLGVAEDDPRSLHRWMVRAFCEPLGISADRIIRLVGNEADPDVACRAYDAHVAEAGGVDLAILGLGPNGHLGFNEPPTSADAPTRAVTLARESIQSNARYWNTDAVPTRALTAGMSLILAARRVLLLVAGAHKADILRRMLHSDPDPWLPASWLHAHPDATLVADRPALPARSAVR